MNPFQPSAETPEFAPLADEVVARLALNQPVRRTLPGEGRLRFDRQLPFLCVYRSPPQEDLGTQELVTTEAAYLFADGAETYHDGLVELCRRMSEAMQEHFGSFLFLEVWADANLGTDENAATSQQPAFEIVAPEVTSLPATIDAFTAALGAVEISGQPACVTLRKAAVMAPPGLRSLSPVCQDNGGCFLLGIAVRPIYRDPPTGRLFPLVLQALRSQLSDALRKAISQFTGFDSESSLIHFQSLGPTSLVKAARLVDQQLCEVSESFDFLLQVTPTNADAAWEEFRAGGCRKPPAFFYRPLPYNPSLLKRRLFAIEVERIEDPTLAQLCWEKQEELDRQLTALRDLDTPQFLFSSLQLYGDADDSLVGLATDILRRFSAPIAPLSGDVTLTLDEIAVRAREEIDHYHQRMNEFNATVELCNHISSGIMVSHDRLLISETVKLGVKRIQSLLHHEVGTHLLTYFNGRCQPFRQLYAGLAGYDELQEGLAVMAEYLTGGFTINRLRTLAGRVLAVRSMTDGDPFLRTFAMLRDEHRFSARQAFTITLRAHRAGGLTKDIIYLRGLRDVLEYLSNGHDIEPLYVGKIGLRHLPYVQEMRRRGIIAAPGVLPRFWDDPKLRDRLEASRGMSIIELVECAR